MLPAMDGAGRVWWARGPARAVLGLLLGTVLMGCGAAPPPRGVLERDLDGWAFRRYQRVLDVEFPVAGVRAVGHTASYLRRRGDRVDVAIAFVTEYERARGLAAELRRQLGTLASYEPQVVEWEGEYVWRLQGGEDNWYVWVSGSRIVKVGAPHGEPPEVLLEAYLDLYESDLGEHGRARPGTPSAGTAEGGDGEAETEGEGPPEPVLEQVRRAEP